MHIKVSYCFDDDDDDDEIHSTTAIGITILQTREQLHALHARCVLFVPRSRSLFMAHLPTLFCKILEQLHF